MAAEVKNEIELEIAHVLFIDIVAYSKLSVNEQHARIGELNQIVRESEQFRKAEAANRMLKIPTGDGMALIFYKSPEEPVQCAVEISRVLKGNQHLQVRMGIHSGPVSGVLDVNERTNVAGAGINMAQRVMDCGDAGHILLSHHVTEDLAEYECWRPFLHDIGTFEVKHGVRVNVTNLHSDEVGNAQLPKKLQAIKKHRTHACWAAVVIGLLMCGAIAGGAFFFSGSPLRLPAPIVEKSIAVLPFENLSRDPDNAFFTDGVQDEILTKLSRIADLKVISRTSTSKYKSKPEDLRTTAKQLGVAHILEGSVQRTANKVHVNVQLIDARGDAHLWAESYDREVKDVFEVESEVSQKIANSLQAKLSPAEKHAMEQRPTSDLIAFDQYTRAKTLILASSQGGSARKNLLQAIELLDSAVERDPSFHAAFCQLVFAHGQLYTVWDDHTPARLAAAEAALKRAMELRPDAAETHLARGAHLYRAFRDYKGALSELELARVGLPNDPRIFELVGYILRRQGKSEEGLRALEQVVAIDPRNPFTLTQLSFSYEELRRYPEAKATFLRVLEITPGDVGVASSVALVDLAWRGQTAPLHQFIERLRNERPAILADAADNWFDCALAERDWPAAEQALTALGNNPFWGDGATILSRQFGEGLLARAMHDDARAHKAFTAARLEQQEVVQKQKDYGPALCVLGLIDAALGNKEAALQEGRRAMELLPVEKDSLTGQALMAYFALIAAWTGEKDLALQQLATAAPTPGAALIASYGMLKLSPFWDPLRGDPRFEKIVASLAPKQK